MAPSRVVVEPFEAVVASVVANLKFYFWHFFLHITRSLWGWLDVLILVFSSLLTNLAASASSTSWWWQSFFCDLFLKNSWWTKNPSGNWLSRKNWIKIKPAVFWPAADGQTSQPQDKNPCDRKWEWWPRISKQFFKLFNYNSNFGSLIWFSFLVFFHTGASEANLYNEKETWKHLHSFSSSKWERMVEKICRKNETKEKHIITTEL